MDIKEQLSQIAGENKAAIEKTANEINARLSEIEKGNTAFEGQFEKLQDLVNDYHKAAGNTQEHLDAMDARFKELEKAGLSAKEAVEYTAQEMMAKSMAEQGDTWHKFARSPRAHEGIILTNQLIDKAAGTMTFAASTTGDVADQTRLSILPAVDRVNRIRNLIPQGVMTGDSVRFPKDTGGEGTAANQTEGNAKSQIDRDLAEQTYNAQVIAGFVPISTQMLNDIAGITSYLSFELTRQLMNQEDSQLLEGDGTGVNLFGLGAAAADANDLSTTINYASPNNWDCISAAMGYLASQDFQANRVLVSPADFYQMAGAKGSNGQYVSPVYFEPDGTARLFGMVINHSTAVAEGDFYVWDAEQASQIFQREAPSIQFFPQDSDNAQKNLVTVRVEERLAHVRYRDNAVFASNYTAVKGIITPS